MTLNGLDAYDSLLLIGVGIYIVAGVILIINDSARATSNGELYAYAGIFISLALAHAMYNNATATNTDR